MSYPRCRAYRIFVGLPVNIWVQTRQAIRYAWVGHL
jgi:hypothetical protein